MLWSMARLRGYGLHTRDGTLGRVVTALFDDRDWTVRSLVVDTEAWGCEVPLPAHVLGEIDAGRQEIHVQLTGQQVRHGPEVGATASDSDLYGHFGPPQPWHSAKALTGCQVLAHDREVGSVTDLMIDDDGWRLRYLVITESTWPPDRRVPLPPEWIIAVDWNRRTLAAALDAELIRTSPAYVDQQVIDRAFEERLFAHYGRPVYW